MRRRAIRCLGFGACAAVVVAGILATPAIAQRGGGRGSLPSADFKLTRLEILASSFTLNKDQKKAVKTILDAAHTNASSARDGLTRTRAAIAAAIQANKGRPRSIARSAEIAEQAAAMTAVGDDRAGRDHPDARSSSTREYAGNPIGVLPGARNLSRQETVGRHPGFAELLSVQADLKVCATSVQADLKVCATSVLRRAFSDTRSAGL